MGVCYSLPVESRVVALLLRLVGAAVSGCALVIVHNASLVGCTPVLSAEVLLVQCICLIGCHGVIMGQAGQACCRSGVQGLQARFPG